MTIDIFVLALAASPIAYFLGWRRTGIAVSSLVAATFMIILCLPVGKWLAAPLENDIVLRQRPDNVTGIVILGGSFDRILAGAELAYDFPTARIIVTGNSFARPGARILATLGLDLARITIEDKSQDTWGDLREAQVLAAPKPGQLWLLVTSAVHVPRAMGVARHLGWSMLPEPTHFLSQAQGASFNFAEKAGDIDEAVHEYLGLAAYRLEGRTDVLFPRPSPEGRK